MSPPKSTPMIKQYLTIKDQYPDAILFYRMGDFYEMFFEDAQIASRALEITLTSRNKNDESPVPMCGVPHRAAQTYIARLIDKGYKVAVCDQIEDPAKAKGLVKRDVVRVITPGMIIENELLDERTNNYVLALQCQNGLTGIAFVDISTGAFRIAESEDSKAIIEEIQRISPSEILLPESSKSDPAFLPIAAVLTEISISYLEDRAFEYKGSYTRLTDQFKTVSLEGFGCQNLKVGICAAGAVIFYVRETQKQKLEHLTRIETHRLDSYLMVDELSWQNLELSANLRTGSRRATLLDVIDQTVTAMGARLLVQWMRYPLMDLNEIALRHEAVGEAKQNIQIRQSIRETLKSISDIERIGNKIVMGHANARDLTALKRSLQMLPALESMWSELKSELFRSPDNIEHLPELADLIDRAIREDAPPVINEGGIIKTGYNPELDELMQISRDAKGWLAQLEVREKENTGINTLKVRYNKVFGYYIEIPKSRSGSAPVNYVRKQTLVNAERYITDELKSFEMKILGAEDQRATLEYEIFNEIRDEVVKNNRSIQKAARFIARIDGLTNLAEVAAQNDYCRPEMVTDGDIFIEDGRHPVIEKMITAERFVPNTLTMDDRENQVLIITGPNMAGKSTVLRQVALIVIMAQMGAFIPAARAKISLTDRIFTRVGALDNLSQGQSTFMVEMQETANILNNATAKSLVIMDEIGRGTSTFDGLSIAWAVAEYLHDLKGGEGVKTLFATHYHELTELARTHARVQNLNIAVKEWNDEIIFLRKLVQGGTNRSYGIQVARLAGIPTPVIDRAKRILYKIEQEDYYSSGSPGVISGNKSAARAPVQLDLFSKAENRLIEKLVQTDISRMTPLEALNFLNEFQEKIKT